MVQNAQLLFKLSVLLNTCVGKAIVCIICLALSLKLWIIPNIMHKKKTLKTMVWDSTINLKSLVRVFCPMQGALSSSIRTKQRRGNQRTKPQRSSLISKSLSCWVKALLEKFFWLSTPKTRSYTPSR